jgi:polyhydroxybutyrate depolymerase
MRIAPSLVLAVLLGCGGGGDGDDTAGDDIAGDDAPGVDARTSTTAGCGLASEVEAESFVQQTITVGGGVGARDYFIRIPAGYDPARPYPIVYQHHGCSSEPDRETNNVPLEGQSGAGAILVRGKAATDCWDTAPAGPDVAYWDAMVADVDARWCIDPARRFATGYSSGSFMTHRLACLRGDLLRGVATIAGGQAEADCAGDPAALLIHDLNDGVVGIGASEAARDSYLSRNSCDLRTEPTPTDHPPCVEYAGCADGRPVVWCMTTGQQHDRQDGLAAPIFWDFLSSLQ